jgi:hypothetical protein
MIETAGSSQKTVFFKGTLRDGKRPSVSHMSDNASFFPLFWSLVQQRMHHPLQAPDAELEKRQVLLTERVYMPGHYKHNMRPYYSDICLGSIKTNVEILTL